MSIFNKKKSGKHILLLLSGLILAVACISTMRPENTSASCGWTMTIGGEDLPCGQGTNSSGTVKSEFIGDDWTGYYKVTLNNYQGGAFYYACRGTSSSCSFYADKQKIVFELIGNNVISAPEGFGIDSFVPIEFTGQGNLKIEAKIPVGGSFFCQWSGDSSTGEESCLIDETAAIGVEWYTLPTVSLNITPETITGEPETPSQNQSNQDENTTPTEDEKVPSGSNGEEKNPDSAPTEQASNNGWTVWDILAAIYIGLSLVVFLGLTIQYFIKHKKVSTSKNTTSQNSKNSSNDQNHI